MADPIKVKYRVVPSKTFKDENESLIKGYFIKNPTHTVEGEEMTFTELEVK